MPRSPHAAKVLRDQLIAKLRRSPDSEAGRGTMTPNGEPDGLGVYRSFTFDPVASKVLAQVLPAIDDPRIVGFEEKGTGKNTRVTVEFSTHVRADERTPFPIDAVDAPEEEPTDQT